MGFIRESISNFSPNRIHPPTYEPPRVTAIWFDGLVERGRGGLHVVGGLPEGGGSCKVFKNKITLKKGGRSGSLFGGSVGAGVFRGGDFIKVFVYV